MPFKLQPLFLCAGLQSSGSTLASWCFLQRSDMDGVLDARNDVLPELPVVTTPALWCKITISSFRFTELIDYFEDDGWRVHPLLVVRDVRTVFNSLMSKHYGSNGTTAEEPPLRTRLRRFREDWEALRDRCVVLSYEKMLTAPEPALRECCRQFGLPWDDAMLEWPKSRSDMADPGHGSPTFRKTRGASFADTADPELAAARFELIPSDDLIWIEKEFAEFNRAMGYVAHVGAGGSAADAGRAVPSWQNTRRYRVTQKPMAKFSAACARVRDTVRYAVFPSYRKSKGHQVRRKLTLASSSR
jgi:hypothetical protein